LPSSQYSAGESYHAQQMMSRDLRRAEALSFPITLVVLLIAFGAVVAALLPLGLALMAILAATGLTAFTSHLSGETTQASSVLLCIGLAVGVDYSMFYVKRQREERAAGRPVLEAIEVAAATSGRSVLISASSRCSPAAPPRPSSSWRHPTSRRPRWSQPAQPSRGRRWPPAR
jgi:uncharacterized membrane protein YdfJ with MMPL/SSD domain